jgi:hypothetical protein
MLSQSRKFGLYLWMVVQTLSEVPDELMGSIQANVGPILAFRGSPDDARKLAKLLHPQRTEAVESLIPGLEDYAAVVRKRPVGGKPVEPPFRVTFPKLREPVHDYGEAMDYMKGDMEKLYGGTVGDRGLVYLEELEKAKRDRGECPLGGPLYWVPLAYLHHIGTEIAFSHMGRIFEDWCGWERNVLQVGLSFLADRGWVEAKARAGQLYRGMDPETKQPMWKEPETAAEKMQARQVFYSITQAAEDEFFRFDPKKWRKSGRVGGPMHVRTMGLLLEEYWEKGYWCAFDKGDRTGPFPDILYTKPLIIYAKGKEGRTVARTSTDEWDEESRTPVEVEISPSKNPEQVRNNYAKDFAMCEWAVFVVVTRTQVTDIRNILLDKDRTTFEVVYKDVGLPEDDLEKLIAQGDALLTEASEADGGKEPGSAEQRAVNKGPGMTEAEQPPALQRNEIRLLALVLSSGYTNKAALASDLGVTGRQVTRYLVHLEALELLARKGRGYWLMQRGREMAERSRESQSDRASGNSAQATLA